MLHKNFWQATPGGGSQDRSILMMVILATWYIQRSEGKTKWRWAA